MVPDEHFRWPAARSLKAPEQLWRVYSTALGDAALWRDLLRYCAAILVYFLVTLGGGWLWARYKGVLWTPVPLPGSGGEALSALDALLFFGGLNSFNVFLPTLVVCVGDAAHYLLHPKSKKPALVGRLLMGFPLFVGLAIWWYHRQGLVVGWQESLVAGSAMFGAVVLFKVQIGKTCRDLELPSVLTWHLFAWLGVAGYRAGGLAGIAWASLPLLAALLLLAVIVFLRGQGTVIRIASLEVHDRDEDSLRLPAVNLSLLFIALLVAFAVGIAVCGLLAWLGVLQFSLFQFSAAARLAIMAPIVLLVLVPMLSVGADAESIAEQLVQRHIVVREKRGDSVTTVPPGPATAQHVAGKIRRSAMLTYVLVILVVAGVLLAFHLASRSGYGRALFPLGDVVLLAVIAATVRLALLLRDFVGMHYDGSRMRESGHYIAPEASVVSPELGGLGDLLRPRRG